MVVPQIIHFIFGFSMKVNHPAIGVPSFKEPPIYYVQCGAPKIAKLVYNSNNYGLWYL